MDTQVGFETNPVTYCHRLEGLQLEGKHRFGNKGCPCFLISRSSVPVCRLPQCSPKLISLRLMLESRIQRAHRRTRTITLTKTEEPECLVPSPLEASH